MRRWRRAGPALAIAVMVVGACSGGSADPDRFCEITDQLEQVGDFFSLPPDRAEAPARRFLDLITEAHRVAPEEIRDQVGGLAEGYADLFPDYVAAGFDASRLDDARVEGLFRTEEDVHRVREAGGVPIEDWVADHCTPGG